jgi:hypothetical protein
MSLLYLSVIPAAERIAFEAKVRSVASYLGTDPNNLMQVMKSESGLSPSIENTSFPFSNGFATGLIQFTPSTAIALGITVAALKAMTRVDQMDYVQKYFAPYKGKLKSYFDVYLVTFFPVGVSHTSDDSWVFETSHIARSSVAKSNPVIDLNKDGVITMAEFKQYCINTVPAANRALLFAAGSSLLVVFFCSLLF